MELNTGKDKTYRLKCPTCQKGYIVKDAEIFSSEPEFECLYCREKFVLTKSATDPENFQARRVMDPKKIAQALASSNSPRSQVWRAEQAAEAQRIQAMLAENANRLKPSRSKLLMLKILKYGPGPLAALLIVVGLSSHSLRNLVGAGVAILVLVVGFRMIRSGEFRIKDHF